ncbi:MAG: LacI family DNA-binding transcriptional regulator [Actinobacteria bacterium]|nr:LacI family DNA-binding transcriptional regulator [Actinomycetota bacterium]
MSRAADPKRHKATMRDVAERAGVSVQTVSNLVNGREHEMTLETRERVTQAMIVLDYRPNATARGLRSQRTRALGFLVLDDDAKFLADPMTDMIMAGAGDVARENGYGMLIQSERFNGADDHLLRPLRESRVDGVLLYLSGEPNMRAALIRRVVEMGYPGVIFGESPDAQLASVTAANYEGAFQLASHLLEKGHRRIAFAAARTSWPQIEDRYSGYRAALQQAGIEPARELQLFRGRWDAAAGVELAEALLDLREPPTAIMAANDLLALGVMHAARARGLQVPGDLAISGFNDFAFSAFVEPSLTTVSLPVYDMGRAAAMALVDRLEGSEAVASQQFEVEVLLRGST